MVIFTNDLIIWFKGAAGVVFAALGRDASVPPAFTSGEVQERVLKQVTADDIIVKAVTALGKRKLSTFR